MLGLENFFTSNAALNSTPTYWSLFFYGWVFAATAATIPSGALAERCQLR